MLKFVWMLHKLPEGAESQIFHIKIILHYTMKKSKICIRNKKIRKIFEAGPSL